MAESSSSSMSDHIAQKLWEKLKLEQTKALYAPFIIGLGAGTLAVDDFLHFIAQEDHILFQIRLTCETAIERTDDEDAKVEIRQLMRNVHEMFNLHDTFFKRFGMVLEKKSIVDPVTVKYITFLVTTAYGKVGVQAPGNLAAPPFAAYIIGAVTPRIRLYAFLGKELQQARFDHHKDIHPHQEWIEYFSSDSFQEEAKKTEKLLEKLSVSLTREELDIVEKLYHQAMKLEVEFLLARSLEEEPYIPLSYGRNSESHRLVLCSAFDSTCTVLDSSAILAELACLTASKSDQTQSENQLDRILSANLRGTWEELFKQYTTEYKQCMERILVGHKADKVDHVGLSAAIHQVSVFEKIANARVIAFEALKGLSVEDVIQSGEHMILQDGCMNFFRSAVNSLNFTTVIHVISYSWSRDLIRSAFSSGGLDSVNVHANELIYENEKSTGGIIARIESPVDKAVVFASIAQNCGTGLKNLKVYIGGTVGDLLCLLQADIGIVINPSPSLRRLGAHFGVSFLPLLSAVLNEERRLFQEQCPIKEKNLYTVSSWDEIHAFILGF